MTFREAFLTACKQSKLTKRQMEAVERIKTAPPRHPRLWRMCENVVAHRYERDTGKKIVAGFDWSTIIDWIKNNIPTIIRIILSILMLFAL